jgi:site-specific DNA-methyltransferase (adenine-specific)
MTEWKSDDGRVRLINGDCMDFMRGLPDKCYELALADPPYGVDMSQELFKRGQSCAANGYKQHADKDWDKNTPDKKFFNEIFRVSVNQIIWGANYMTSFLSEQSGWAVWNKVQRGFSFGDGELAWTSFGGAVKIFDYARGNESGFAPKLPKHEKPFANIHPTQKPVALYRWLLHNYAKEGDRILDTHGGSMSSVVACHEKGFAITCCELDADYYAAGLARVKAAMQQQTLDFGGNP